MQKFPDLINNQLALMRTDAQTGRALDEMLKLVINDEQKAYTVLNSYYDAVQLAKSIIFQEKNVECVIYKRNQEVLFTFSGVIENAFNLDFCIHLEYYLCRTFSNSPDVEINRLGCLGVDVPHENHLAMAKVIETKKITATAWIEANRGDRYNMKIKLGKNSIDKFKKGLSLIDCLPSEESLDWITIDTDKKTIELQLT
ncbi:MAG TPA: hypothetical protein VGI43_09730 [Mucilaginibacter sp.]|jgi:hypothetical protein